MGVHLFNFRQLLAPLGRFRASEQGMRRVACCALALALILGGASHSHYFVTISSTAAPAPATAGAWPCHVARGLRLPAIPCNLSTLAPVVLAALAGYVAGVLQHRRSHGASSSGFSCVAGAAMGPAAHLNQLSLSLASRLQAALELLGDLLPGHVVEELLEESQAQPQPQPAMAQLAAHHVPPLPGLPLPLAPLGDLPHTQLPPLRTSSSIAAGLSNETWGDHGTASDASGFLSSPRPIAHSGWLDGSAAASTGQQLSHVCSYLSPWSPSAASVFDSPPAAAAAAGDAAGESFSPLPGRRRLSYSSRNTSYTSCRTGPFERSASTSFDALYWPSESGGAGGAAALGGGGCDVPSGPLSGVSSVKGCFHPSGLGDSFAVGGDAGGVCAWLTGRYLGRAAGPKSEASDDGGGGRASGTGSTPSPSPYFYSSLSAPLPPVAARDAAAGGAASAGPSGPSGAAGPGAGRLPVRLGRCSSQGCCRRCGGDWNSSSKGGGGGGGGSGSGYLRGSGGSCSSAGANGSGSGYHCSCGSGCGGTSVGTTGAGSGTSSGSGFVSADESSSGFVPSGRMAVEDGAGAVLCVPSAPAAPFAWGIEQDQRSSLGQEMPATTGGGSSRRLTTVAEADATAPSGVNPATAGADLCDQAAATSDTPDASAAGLEGLGRGKADGGGDEDDEAEHGLCELRRACSRVLSGRFGRAAGVCDGGESGGGGGSEGTGRGAAGRDGACRPADGESSAAAAAAAAAGAAEDADADDGGDILSMVWLSSPARTRRPPWPPSPWTPLTSAGDGGVAAAAAAAGVALTVESPAASRRTSIEVRNGWSRGPNSGCGMPTFSGMLALSAAAAVAPTTTSRSGAVSSSTARSTCSVDEADDSVPGGGMSAGAERRSSGGSTLRPRGGGGGSVVVRSPKSSSTSPPLLSRALLDRGLMKALETTGGLAQPVSPPPTDNAVIRDRGGDAASRTQRAGATAAGTSDAASGSDWFHPGRSWVQPEGGSGRGSEADDGAEPAAAAAAGTGTGQPSRKAVVSAADRGSPGGVLGFGLRRVKTSIAELFSLGGDGPARGGELGGALGFSGGTHVVGGGGSVGAAQCEHEAKKVDAAIGTAQAQLLASLSGGAGNGWLPAGGAHGGDVDTDGEAGAGIGGGGGSRVLQRRSLSIMEAGERMGAGAAKILRAAGCAAGGVVGGLLYGASPPSPVSLSAAAGCRHAPSRQVSAPTIGAGLAAADGAVLSPALPLSSPAGEPMILRASGGSGGGGGNGADGSPGGSMMAPWLASVPRSLPLPALRWPPLPSPSPSPTPSANAPSPRTCSSPVPASTIGSPRLSPPAAPVSAAAPPLASLSTLPGPTTSGAAFGGALSPEVPPLPSPGTSLPHHPHPQSSPLSPVPSLLTRGRSMSWCSLNILDGAPEPPESPALRAAAAAAAAARAALRRLLPSDPAAPAECSSAGAGAGVPLLPLAAPSPNGARCGGVQGGDAPGASPLGAHWPAAAMQRRPSGVWGHEEAEAGQPSAHGDAGGGANGGPPAAAVRFRRLHRASTGLSSSCYATIGAGDGSLGSADMLAYSSVLGALMPSAAAAPAAECAVGNGTGGGTSCIRVGRGSSCGSAIYSSGGGGAGGFGYSLGRDLPYAEWHPSVSVLFADVVGFTQISDRVPAVAVMEMLNALYCRLDALCSRWQAGQGMGLGGPGGAAAPSAVPPVYKVQIIGDAYMVATGLLADDPAHAATACLFALACLREAAQVVDPCEGRPLRLRVGVHSGPVVSGVVGRLRRQYSVFGDTVNVASRMESTGAPGAIHVSADTQRLAARYLQPPYLPHGSIVWRQRTGVEVKGKGVMDTYWLEEAPLQPPPLSGPLPALPAPGPAAAPTAPTPEEDVECVVHKTKLEHRPPALRAAAAEGKSSGVA